MAKSRVLQILEYDEQQRQTLIKNLKSKNINSTQGESLASLVEKVNSINIDTVDDVYGRDPNFPNIDELFENDPLRMANGGQYKCCSYGIYRLTETNQIRIYEYYNATYGARKIVVSDGKEYNNISTTIQETYTVQENGIYVGEDGFKYCMVIVYTNDVNTTTGTYHIPSGAYEYIEDKSLFVNKLTPQSITPNTSPANMRYYRFAGSNNTKELIDMYATATSYSATVPAENVVLEGIIPLTSFTNTYASLKSIKIDCELYVPKNTSTNLSADFGSTSTVYVQTVSTVLPSFKPPYSEKPLALKLGYSAKKIFLSDYVSTFTMHGADGAISNTTDLHIGNGLTDIIRSTTSTNTGSAPSFYSLKNITVSEGAYGLNTSALTLDFSKSDSLTRQSVLNMFNNFADRTGKTANVLKLNAFTKTLVTNEEKTILTNKNWTLS